MCVACVCLGQAENRPSATFKKKRSYLFYSDFSCLLLRPSPSRSFPITIRKSKSFFVLFQPSPQKNPPYRAATGLLGDTPLNQHAQIYALRPVPRTDGVERHLISREAAQKKATAESSSRFGAVSFCDLVVRGKLLGDRSSP